MSTRSSRGGGCNGGGGGHSSVAPQKSGGTSGGNGGNKGTTRNNHGRGRTGGWGPWPLWSALVAAVGLPLSAKKAGARDTQQADAASPALLATNLPLAILAHVGAAAAAALSSSIATVYAHILGSRAALRTTAGSSGVQGTSASAPVRRVVLFVEPSPFTYTSGVSTRFRETAKEMVRAGCAVLVVTPGQGMFGLLPGGQAQPTEFEGAKVLEAGSFPCPFYASVPLSFALSSRIYTHVRAWRPDIIHCTSPGTLPLGAWVYSRLLSVPLVVSYHTDVPHYLHKMGLGFLARPTWALIRFTHWPADLTITVSPVAAADLVKAGASAADSVKVWPKAVDNEAFSPERACVDMRRRLMGGTDHGGPLLLYIGRVSTEKNVELLKPVFDRVLAAVPDARLAIAGEGPAKQDMQRLLAGTPTTFLGVFNQQELAQAYASADIFVMPSESETLGNVVGEAMASGLVPVAADAGGVPCMMGRPGHSGLLFPPGNVEAAAEAICRLASDGTIRRRMSQAAREEMEQCSWTNATQEILTQFYPAAKQAWLARWQAADAARLL